MTHTLNKADSQRIHDLNGWFEVKRNPLSKVGIYDYSGAQIGAPPEDAQRIFKVYRPAEELGDPEAVNSFKLVPFIDDHTMLGEGFTSVDDRPAAGVVGESVFFEDDTLYGNIKVYSKALAEKIKSGKTEISMGYRCRYDFTPGVWNGEQYDVVQRNLQGNHGALVDEGRMGPEVSILDQLTFAVDAKELTPVDNEKLDQILEALAALTARVEAIEAKDPAADADAETVKTEEPAKDEEVPEDIAKDLEEVAAEVTSEDGKLKLVKIATAVANLAGRVHAIDSRPAMDERAIVSALADRTSLAERLSTHVGTFDYAKMTHAEVASYGVEKLGIKGVVKGQEVVALDAYLQAKPDPTKTTTVAQDKAPSALSARIAKHGAKE